MSVYVLVDIEVTDSEKYREYISEITPSVKRYGGRYLVRGGSPETLDGDWRSTRMVVMEFGSRTEAKAWLNDKSLASIHAMRRENSSRCNMILCDGYTHPSDPAQSL